VEQLTNHVVAELLDLNGKHFFVTGASSGIGQAVAWLFDSLGARLTLVDLNSAGLEETAARCSRNDHQLFEFDLSHVEAIDFLVKNAVAGVGALDGFVHCAGIQTVMPARVLTAAAWRKIFAVNAESGLAVAKCFSSKRVRANNGGSIVFISSAMALVGSPGATAYSMSKSALHGIARSLALEFAANRIRVNCIAPGFVKTPMFERVERLWNDSRRAAVEAQHPLGFGSPNDIANAAAFLCANTGRWITGTVMVVDGGYLAQ
jgi:NAD(P)-dependent dehydrogenase (short-subunit alcohol dehydrogenase family)